MMSTKMRSGWWSAIFRERVETVLREDHLAAGLHEKDLRRAPDGVAVIDHHHAYACEALGVRHASPRFLGLEIIPFAQRKQRATRSFSSPFEGFAPPFRFSTISKSSLRAPHSGQHHPAGMSSHRVPGGIPSSGQPSASS
jgi:hypothetical protein